MPLLRVARLPRPGDADTAHVDSMDWQHRHARTSAPAAAMLQSFAAVVVLLLALLATAGPARALPPTEHEHGIRDAATNVVLAQARARGVAELPPSPFLRRTACGAAQDRLRSRGVLQRRALVRLRHAQRSGNRIAVKRAVRAVRSARAATRVARARAVRACASTSRRATVGEDGERLVGSRRVERPRATIAGTGMVLALPIDFSDAPARRAEHAPARYEELFFGDAYPHGGGSLDRYWRDMSYGAFSVDGSVARWRRMPRPRTAYAGGRGGMGAFPSNSQSLLEDAVRANDASIDFGRYDNDGPDGRPNSGDDDGIVDAIFLVYAGTGAVEEGGLDGIWPHAWRRAVETRDRAAGGGTISVDRYAALPERMATPGSDGDLLTVGIAAHEYGHVLGLPDLVGHGDDPGPGRWDLMGSGVWGFRDSSRPTGLSTWSRARLGWIAPTLLTGDHPDHAMPATYGTRSAVKLPLQGQPLHEHFLVERRTRTGFDADLPGDGLLAWHVDDSQPADGSGTHARVRLVPADGTAGDDAGDLLRAGGHLSDSSRPSTRAHDGDASLVAVQNVRTAPDWLVDLHAGEASLAPAIDAEIDASGPQAAPPVVALTTPTEGAFLRGIVTMTCEASGAPNISRMTFLRAAGATALANMNINPSAASVIRTYDWDTTGVVDGPDTLGCRARNTSNQWTDSALVNVVVDNTAPAQTAPGDGAAAPDIASQTDTTTLAAHWAAGTDATSGIASYDWQFCTDAACGVILAGGATATPAASAGGLALTPGSTYYACIRANDRAGNSSAWTCSNGVLVVDVPPAMGAVRDGAASPDLAFQSSTTELALNWDAATGGTGGVASYQWRACTAPDCATVLASGSTTALTATATALALADGTTYHACVSATSGSGTSSAASCSDGVTVDATAPTMATVPGDGPAAPELDFQASTTSLDAHWAAATDAGSGVASYDWRFCTTAACATVLASGTTTALAAGATGLALADGAAYVACVRAVDIVANTGAWTCSDGVTVDATVPTMPIPDDGAAAPDVDWQASTTTLAASWAAATGGGSGIAGYEWRLCASTACSSILASGSTATTTASATGLALADATSWFACVRAIGNTGATSAWSCSDGVTVDTSAPAAPIPADGAAAPDVDAQSSTSQLDATWPVGTDTGSGVTTSDWRFCADAACGTILASGSGGGTSATATGLTLTVGATYYACVRGTDLVGNVGAWGCSDGVTVTTGPSVTIGAPADGASVRGTVAIDATALDAVGVTRVEYLVDGVLHHTDGPFTATTSRASTWSMATTTIPIADGPRVVEVRAYDGGGAWGSATITVVVDNTAPGAATFGGITAGSTISGVVSITGSGTDAQGIVKADYSIAGPTIVQTTTTTAQASFSDAWAWDTTTVLDGNHTMRVTLRDAAGNPAASPLVRHIVHNAGDVTPPSGAIDPSLDGATLSGAVSLLANVSDDNAIVKVEFLIDGVLVSTADTGMPAGYVSGQRTKTWTSTAKPNGGYVLSARITDAGGNVTTTAGVAVTVAN